MNISARTNQTLKIMKKIENKQNFNRMLFLATIGVAFHSMACIGAQKKLHPVDYIGLPVFAFSVHKACSLHKKEEKGQKLWHTLQRKSALEGNSL